MTILNIMNLRVLSWNVRKARKNSLVWKIISQINPVIATLQEVISIPDFISANYSTILRKAVSKNGNQQIFSMAVLVKGELSNNLILTSEFEWVNIELEIFKGNLLSCVAKIDNLFPINIVSIHSPAWPVNKDKLKNIDVSQVKLKLNANVWCADILWCALKSNGKIKTENWIVSGYFNSSITFDYMWSGGPRGCQEAVDRMNSIGFIECLNSYNGKVTPTFRNPKGGKVIHQIDHMYVTQSLYSSLTRSYVGDSFDVFEKSISDHLQIISDFNIEVDTN